MSSVQVTYPPLDVPKPVTEGVWIVDSGPLVAFGMPLPVRMTVIRLADGSLLLHSPTRFSRPLKEALERIGPVAHLVAPNIAHWLFLKEWQQALPEVTTWAAPGLRDRAPVRRAGVTLDRDLGPTAPPAWAAEMEHIVVPGAVGFQEIALFHKASRTLLLCDIVQGLEPHKLPLLTRLAMRALGGAGPFARPPIYLRMIVKRGGAPARDAAARLIALDPARVIFTHGRWFMQDGAAQLRRSLGWLVG